ncbi:SDR family NAD(P)-dependent oxidoreductase [Amaricoccus solimangrovi]|uniref:SDR family NAD(P)-dependent oxidoreductase n=1 Tax=Amaricoccus solimangrovi TaxID=2589815 RepID=A0A501WM90_9RHOB|nr:SDR family NAD(P)-dependent oxidoreductase [Amaricoccus solimangrovi]TPE49445.1 SDR family NAD(P)-dependent oxidoreductase [Amaricoccus solimangrovi]
MTPTPSPADGSARSILITGCSSGIGLDAARTLAARGWRVLATCRDPKDCERLETAGLESFPLDLSCEDSIRRAIPETAERLGGMPDALFNNGAFAIPGAVEDMPRAAFREIFEVNLLGQFDLTNRILPGMRARGSGRIVMNSSVLGLVAAPWRGAYVATKFALEGLTDTLRLELRGSGIAVVLIEPGPIGTPFRAKSIPRFERHVNWRASPHAARYARELLPRLYAERSRPDRFELPPGAVTAKLVAALEAKRPAARYTVTHPARAAAILRRLLPARWLDRVVAGR